MLSENVKKQIMETMEQLETSDQHRVLEYAHDLLVSSTMPAERPRKEMKDTEKKFWDMGSSSHGH